MIEIVCIKDYKYIIFYYDSIRKRNRGGFLRLDECDLDVVFGLVHWLNRFIEATIRICM